MMCGLTVTCHLLGGGDFLAPQDGVDGTHLSGLLGESHPVIRLAELAWQLASIKKSSRNDAFIIFIINPPKISQILKLKKPK